MRCTGCGAEYPLTRFIHQLDETMERELANFRCDRI
ncbi:conserved hypothetical protein [Desulfosarcina cetonica]|nr:conserved hypothetical protein [Desulfosarcina cetonica]